MTLRAQADEAAEELAWGIEPETRSATSSGAPEFLTSRPTITFPVTVDAGVEHSGPDEPSVNALPWHRRLFARISKMWSW